MEFHKYHGIGNDFVVVDLRAGDPAPSPQEPDLVRAICDRRFGIGADGVLAILPPDTSDAQARMRVLNADGSEAEMCGNGIRCVVKHLWELDPTLRRPELTIDTGAGPLKCNVAVVDDAVVGVTVDMGRPILERAKIPMRVEEGDPDARWLDQAITAGGTSLRYTAVSMGNPHAVTFVDETGSALRSLAESVGPAIEHADVFPNRTNVEFARVHSPTHIETVVWERGCGITMACGTGACATAVAACLTGHAKPETSIQVGLPGGALEITVANDFSSVSMTGPAALVYRGEVDLARLASR